jgi:hypothetical protein
LKELQKAHITGFAFKALNEKTCSYLKGSPVGVDLAILQARRDQLDPNPNPTSNMIFLSKHNFNYHYQHSHYFAA